MSRARRASVVQAASSALVIVAATRMPWATYRDVGSNATTTFRGGPSGLVLAALGIVSLVGAAVSLVRRSAALDRAEMAVGCAAVVTSIVMTLSDISRANHAALAGEGPSRTSYTYGAGVAVLGSLAIATISLITLANTASIAEHSQPG
jgi:hypothetical protein